MIIAFSGEHNSACVDFEQSDGHRPQVDTKIVLYAEH